MGQSELHSRRFGIAPLVALLSLSLVPCASLQAVTPIRFSGAVSGLVMDSLGKPQPGAAVSLFNQQERLLQRVYTDLAGNFSFGDLLPDLYNIQVSVASFVPATRNRLVVRPGMRSLVEVSLSKMFSSIQVVSTVPAPGGLMSDDWKWTLRSDTSLRPVVRLLPTTASTAAATSGPRAAVFHDSSALVRISASDGALTDPSADVADLGTQFAFATSVYANNRVRVSGDLGYASTTGQPAAAIRTTYSRQFAGDTPSVSVTMRQMSAATRVGQGLVSGDGALPMLRTMSFSLRDKAQLTELLSLQYGTQMDIVTFLDRMQYFSPWARLSYTLPRGHLDVEFSSGNARPGLDSDVVGSYVGGSGMVDSGDTTNGLRNELAAVSMLPRLSERAGQVKVQRGDNYEIGYSQVAGAMEYRVSARRQHISDTALTIANPADGLFSGDLLPSMFASSALFDAGSVSSNGYTVSATRSLGPGYKVTVAYGTVSVITPELTSGTMLDAESLRRALTAVDRNALTVRSTGTIRHLGTRYVASYQSANLKSAVPIASYSAQPDRVDPGLNISLRQPIPMPGMPGRLEATAEMRNILAQGYLPLEVADGRQIWVVNAPRVFRGSLAFVF